MNSLRGAVHFEAGGAQRYLRVTTNAMVRYQDKAGETFLSGILRLQNDSTDVRRLRRMFWACMLHDKDMTEEAIGDLIDEIGLVPSFKLLFGAAEAAFPKADEGNAPSGDQTPPNQTIDA